MSGLHYFSMSSLTDKPHSNVFPTNYISIPLAKRKTIFLDHLLAIIDRYVIHRMFHTKKLQERLQPQPEEVRQNPHLHSLTLDHQYGKSAPPKPSRRLPISITASLDQPVASHYVHCTAEDGVYTYTSAVLNDGLLLLEFKAAIREGDGLRILRCWKALLLHFHSANHYNYAKEAVRMIATVNALATPQVAAQITWSRVVNPTGLQGHNIPVDLKNQHLNLALKEAVSSVGANISQKTITQCGKSLE